jgi:type I restriction enzyme R subunit
MQIYDENQAHKKIVEELTSKGWKFLKEFEFQKTPFIFENVLKEKIYEFNKKFFDVLSLEEKEKILNEAISILKNSAWYNIHRFLKKGIEVPLSKKNLSDVVKLKVIDFENLDNNEFFFVHEGVFGEELKRPDFVLFVNGIPLVVIEAKKETEIKEFDDLVDEALGDILFYEKNKGTKELFNYAFISVLIIGDEGEGFYKASWPESNNKYLLKWKDKDYYKNEKKKENIFGLFEKKILLDLYNNFNFLIKNNEYHRLVANYVQYWATKEVLKDVNKFNKALVWHWQGSGKTWTLFFVAYNYYKKRKKERKKSFIFALLDRIELKEQSLRKYKSILDLDWEFLTVDVIKNGEELLKTLKSISDGKEGSSFFVTLTQKFRDNLLNKAKKINLDLKEEILILVDEAHRSVNGNLLLNVFEIFKRKNIKLVGLTGTPVIANIKEKNGKYELKSGKRNTFRIFSPNIENGKFYSHLYFIKDSINDGITVPLVFDTVVNDNFKIPSKEEIKEKAMEKLKEYYEKSLMDEIEEEQEEDLVLNKREEKKLEEIFNFNNFYLNDKGLIKEKVKYIVQRFEDDTEGFKFKAFIVASNRYACIKYKKAFDEIVKEKGLDLNAEVVISWNSKKDEESKGKREKYGKDVDDLINYGVDLLKKTHNIAYYDQNKLNDLNEKIVDAFTNDKDFYGKKIDVLIVTSKLLTGFDYPKLRVLYLDKVIGGVNLLQAVARTNRIYKEVIEKNGEKFKIEKDNGLIVDLTGISLIEKFNEVIEKYKNIIKLTSGFKDIKVFDDAKTKANNFLTELKIFEEF